MRNKVLLALRAGCALARRRDMPQATALGAKMCRGIFFIAENVCEKAWRRLARVYRGKIAA